VDDLVKNLIKGATATVIQHLIGMSDETKVKALEKLLLLRLKLVTPRANGVIYSKLEVKADESGGYYVRYSYLRP